jgi:TonB family protein
VVRAKVEQGVEGYPELDKAALKAAKACTFEPGTKDGEPVQVWAFIPFEFKLK